MDVTTDFECGGGKRLTRLAEGRWRIEAAGEVDNHNKYFCVKARTHAAEPPAILHLDVYPDSDMGADGAGFFASHFPSHIWYCTGTRNEWLPLRHTWEEAVAFHERHIEVRVPVTGGTELTLASNPPRRYSDMLEWIAGLSADCGVRMRIESIGASAEGRDIPVVRLPGPRPGRPKFLVLAGQHPSEHSGVWASEGIVEYCLSQITEARALADRFDLAVIPMVNPDGNVKGLCAANAEGVNLCTGFAEAAEGVTPNGSENQRLWAWLCDEFRPDALLHFHGGMGWRSFADPPYDGAVLSARPTDRDQAEDARVSAQRAVRDRLLFEAPGLASRKGGEVLGPDYLECQLASAFGAVGVLYHVNAGAVGVGEQFRRGPQVFSAMARGLQDAGL